jgi:hypothetical protein
MKKVFRIVDVSCSTPAKLPQRGHQDHASLLDGRFENLHPIGAAKKAGNKIFKKLKNASRCKLILTIADVTPGSHGGVLKTYRYVISRKKNRTPSFVMRDGKTIGHQYTITAKSLNR